MIKKILFSLILLVPILCKGQGYSNTQAPTQRSNWHNYSIDKYLGIPTISGVPSNTIASYYTNINHKKAGVICYDSTGNNFYIYTGTTWTRVGSQTLDQTLTVGNSTTQTIISGSIIPTTDSNYNLGSIGLRYKNIYSKKLFVGDTANYSLNNANYTFLLNGWMHTNGNIILNDSAGHHTITLGEIGGYASIMAKGSTITFQPEVGTTFSFNQRLTKFYIYTNDMVFQGGQSSDGRELFLSDANDSCVGIWNSNSLRGIYAIAAKIGGTASAPLAIATPTKVIFEVVSTTQGAVICAMSSTQRDAISGTKPDGLQIYNTTTHHINFWNGTEWRQVSDITAP